MNIEKSFFSPYRLYFFYVFWQNALLDWAFQQTNKAMCHVLTQAICMKRLSIV